MDKNYKIIEYQQQPEQTREFLELPFRLYGRNKMWLLPSQNEVLSFLDGRHPFNSFLRHQSFLIERSGRTIGRATAFINQSLVVDGKPVGSIGFFECETDGNAASSLIHAACEWLKAQDVALVWAAMNGTLWSSYRFMIKDFEDIPFVKEPYNKPYYPAFFEQAGFQVLKRWYTGTFAEAASEELLLRLRKINQFLSRRGYQFRRFNLDQFDPELEILYDLVFDAYSDFTGYHQLTRPVFLEAFRNLKDILLPEYAHFAINPAGRPVGFHLFVPVYDHQNHSTGDVDNLNPEGIRALVSLHLGITHQEMKKNNGLGGALAYVGFSAAKERKVQILDGLTVENAPSTVFLNYATGNRREYCLYYKEINR